MKDMGPGPRRREPCPLTTGSEDESASTLTEARPAQDPLWRRRACVHADKSPASSGPATRRGGAGAEKRLSQAAGESSLCSQDPA